MSLLGKKIIVTQCLGVKPYNLHQSPQKFMLYNIVQGRYQSIDKLQCNQLWYNAWHMRDNLDWGVNRIITQYSKNHYSEMTLYEDFSFGLSTLRILDFKSKKKKLLNSYQKLTFWIFLDVWWVHHKKCQKNDGRHKAKSFNFLLNLAIPDRVFLLDAYWWITNEGKGPKTHQIFSILDAIYLDYANCDMSVTGQSD